MTAEEPCRDVGMRTDESGQEDHLEDVPDGSGCTEIWEHLSERRAEDDD